MQSEFSQRMTVSMFLLTLIVLMSFDFTLYSVYRLWELETTFQFFKQNLGLLQYCILIIYVMKSLLFPYCAYDRVFPIFHLKKLRTLSNSDLQFSIEPYTEPVYLYKCKKC